MRGLLGIRNGIEPTHDRVCTKRSISTRAIYAIAEDGVPRIPIKKDKIALGEAIRLIK
jgi:hypothetical protein